MVNELTVFGVLAAALVLFVWGRWRYDLVALAAMVVLTIVGIIPAKDSFSGFGHPAVITVAAVLVVSRGLLNSGLVGWITKQLSRVGDRPTAQVVSLTTLVAVFSAFMNNVGALALLLPVGVSMARSAGRSPSYLLMPLAFGSLLGGLVTMIGTPPNIIIASFRAETSAGPFRMFDFAPVGAGVALAGIVFIAIAWRLVPRREGQASREELFRVEEYIAELRAGEKCKLLDKPLREVWDAGEGEAVIVGLVRDGRRQPAPPLFEILREQDILIIETDSDTLKSLVDSTGLEIVSDYEFKEEDLRSDDVGVLEAIVLPDSQITGRTVGSLNVGWRYGVSILAVARQGARLRRRIGRTVLQAGDILLLQARQDTLQEALQSMGCLPLAQRELRIGQPRRIVLSIGIFGTAMGVAAVGLLPVQIAFTVAAMLMILLRLLSLTEAYKAIDWSVIVLLGAMIPVGEALETTGGAARIAEGIVQASSHTSGVVTLCTLLIGVMFLSDMINNAAAAVLMTPIALRVAGSLEASPDPFLMGVALGSSCAFLTPIGHQSNTLILGPGGYRFGDYWRLGLPLQVVILVVGIPLILHFWPMQAGVG